MITQTAAREIANLAINAYLYFESETDTEHALECAVESCCDDDFLGKQPIIVCLCGSTRFWRLFQRAGLQETMAGRIVLSIGAASGTDDEHFGKLPKVEYDRVKEMLDQLHMRKIDLCDEVLILNEGGYIGESTARELAYAQSLGKRVRLWEDENDPPIARDDLPAWRLSLPQQSDQPQLRAAAERVIALENERPHDWTREMGNEGKP